MEKKDQALSYSFVVDGVEEEIERGRPVRERFARDGNVEDTRESGSGREGLGYKRE